VTARNALRLAAADNVATALCDLAAGAVVEIDDIAVTLREPVPLCHKVALVDLAPGDAVLKYGQPIGRMTMAVPAGGHVHVHNMQSARGHPARGQAARGHPARG
jgi:altronate dehydratase